MDNFYRDVRGLGHVAVSRHALKRVAEQGISKELFEKVLLQPIRKDVPDGLDVVWRERDGIRIVIALYPTPDRGAKLVKTVYRVKLPASAR